MKKMGVAQMRELNGGACKHVGYAFLGKSIVYKLPWQTKEKYRWLCRNCGDVFVTYMYY